MTLFRSGRRIAGKHRIEPPANRLDRRVLVALVAAKLALHAPVLVRHDWNRDELYFLECGRHLAAGYVDHAPLVPWIARACEAVFGTELAGLRLPSLVAGAVAVVLAVVLARDLGGRRWAQLVAGLAALVPPAYLRMGNLLCIPVFELVFSTAATWIVLRIAMHGSLRLWLGVGVVGGLGLLVKHSMLLWWVGTVGALALVGPRAALRTRYFAGALVVAGLFLCPNIIWQVRHDWPTVEFLRSIWRDQLEEIPRWLFLLGQVLYQHPLTLPLWLSGLWFLWRGPRTRFVACAYGIVLTAWLSSHAKPYYLAPAYLPLFAAGAVQLERAIRNGGRSWLRVAVPTALVVGGAALVPFALPVLPLATADRWIERLVGFAIESPVDLTLELHDEYGWREQARSLAHVRETLAAEERATFGILAWNYGEAAALNIFGPAYGLPRAVSGNMSYFLWGPGEESQTVLALGFPRRELEPLFAEIVEAAWISHPLAVPSEKDLTVYVCRGAKQSLRAAWPSLRRYDHDSIQIGGSEGKFTKVRIEVKGSALLPRTSIFSTACDHRGDSARTARSGKLER